MNGIIAVKKEKGYTSRDVVNCIGGMFHTKKVGHTGTLDPMATGVLVVCMGECLKLVELLTNHDKEYVATVRLGIETDTLDITGNVLKEDSNVVVDDDMLDNVLKKFVGNIKQMVPIYSSVKVNGKKLYEYARSGEAVEVPVRDTFVYDLKLISRNGNEFVIWCHVSKGTYIRSLVRDIGYALGTYATLISLDRTSLGNVSLKDAYSIDDIEKGNYSLLNYYDVIDLPRIVVNNDMEKKIKNGQVLRKFFDDKMVFVENEDGKLLAIYQKIDDEFVKPYRVFNWE